MKTLSQLNAKSRENFQSAEAKGLVEDTAWLEEILAKNIPLHVWAPVYVWSADFGPSEYRESFRKKIRTGNRNAYRNAYQRLGCACDHCGTELINPEPGMVLASNPPKRKVACIGCGWAGSTSLILP
jgi:hypothetical protein